MLALNSRYKGADDLEEFTTMQSAEGRRLALRAVSVTGKLEGLLLGTTLRQDYVNDTGQDLEIVYTFPVAWDAALLGLEVEIAGQRLKGQVFEKKVAEAKYEKALEEGDTPIMVQEASPGLYTVNLGGIKAGEAVSVEIRCAQLLKFEQGRVRLKIPTVIAPRYGDAHAQGGLAPHETDAVDGAAQYPLTVRLEILGDSAKAKISSPSHRIAIQPLENGQAVLLERGAVLDRDFILLLEGLKGQSFALAAQDGEEFMALASFCPSLPEKPSPLLLKILVDCSGSMGGDSMAQAKAALKTILRELRAGDFVAYSRFGNNVNHASREMEPCSPEVLERLTRAVAGTEADMGGTEMEKALLATFQEVAGPKKNESRPSLLLITDDLVWDSKSILQAALASGHRVFAVGVGSAPAETLLRQITEKTGGACEFVSPNEDMAATVVRMFRRMRVAQSGKLNLDWGAEPLWQSPLPQSLFDGDTVHVFAAFAKRPLAPPRLSWSMGGQTGQATPETIGQPDNGDLGRLGGANRLENAPNKAEALALALKYQLLSRHSSLFLVYQREGADKLTAPPVLQQTPQMMAAGSHGFGSVVGASIMMGAIGTGGIRRGLSEAMLRESYMMGANHCFAPILSRSIPEPQIGLVGRLAKKLGSRRAEKITPVAGAAFPEPREILAYFDAQALATSNLGQTLKALLGHFSGLEDWNTLLTDLAQQEGATWENAWAVGLAFLAEKLAGEFSLSRQGQRLLRVKNDTLTAAVRAVLITRNHDIFG
ncbi:hypothetical protein FACS189460_0890 [Deltaproteobacteria bacterium]|nr:hypothetical protein FACS189460_0890 [Deltaproteobacteria bacterium]